MPSRPDLGALLRFDRCGDELDDDLFADHLSDARCKLWRTPTRSVSTSWESSATVVAVIVLIGGWSKVTRQ
jgi:hypothetical protein